MFMFLIVALGVTNIAEAVQYNGTEVRQVGCYGTTYARDLELGTKIEDFKLKPCFDFCDMRGTKYAGAQVRTQMCYCSNFLVRNSASYSRKSCSDRCSSEGRDRCGGSRRMTVYQLQENYEPTILVTTENGIARHRGNSLVTIIPIAIKPVDDQADIAYHYKRNEIYFIANLKMYRSKYSICEGRYSNPEVILEAGKPNGLAFIAIDWIKDKLYFTRSGANIYKANLDGTNEEQIINVLQPTGLTIDPYERKLFYQIYKEVMVVKYDLDSGVRENVIKEHFYQIKVDIHSKTIYGKNATELLSVDYDGNNAKKTNFSMFIMKLSVGEGGKVYLTSFKGENVEVHSYRDSLNFLFRFSKRGLYEASSYYELAQAPTKQKACEKLRCPRDCSYSTDFYVQCDCHNDDECSSSEDNSYYKGDWRRDGSRELSRDSYRDYNKDSSFFFVWVYS